MQPIARRDAVHGDAGDALRFVEQPPRQSPFVLRDRGHRGAERVHARQSGAGGAAADRLQVADRGVHPRDVLVGVRPRLELVGRHVRDEVLAKRRQPVDRLAPAPGEPHVRREYLVARAHQVVAVERLHVDRPVRRVMDGVEEDLGADGMCAARNLRDVDGGSRRVRRHRARHQPRAHREQRLEIRRVEARAVAANARLPPDDARACPLQGEPRGDVRLVIEIADDDFRPRVERLPDGEADRADERGRVQPE